MAVHYRRVPQKSRLYESNKTFEMLEDDRKEKNKSMTAAEKRSRKDSKLRLDKLLDDEKIYLETRNDDKYAENVRELSWAIKHVVQPVDNNLNISGSLPTMNPPSFLSFPSVSSQSSRPNPNLAEDLDSVSHVMSNRDAGSTLANNSEETSAQSPNSGTELITIPVLDIVLGPKPFPLFDQNAIDSVGQTSLIEQGVYGEEELGGKGTWGWAAEKLVQETVKLSRSENAQIESKARTLLRSRADSSSKELE